MDLENRNIRSDTVSPESFTQLHPSIRAAAKKIYEEDAKGGPRPNGGTYRDPFNWAGDKENYIRNIVGRGGENLDDWQKSYDPASGKYGKLSDNERFMMNIDDSDITKRLAIQNQENNFANSALTDADIANISVDGGGKGSLSTSQDLSNIVNNRTARERLLKSINAMALPRKDNEQYNELISQFTNRSNLTNPGLELLETRLKDFQPDKVREIKTRGLTDDNLEQSIKASKLAGKQQGNIIANNQIKMQNENTLARAGLADRGNQRKHEALQQTLQNAHNAKQAFERRQLELAIREQSFNDAAAERQLRRDLNKDNEMTQILQFLFSGGQNFRNIIGY